MGALGLAQRPSSALRHTRGRPRPRRVNPEPSCPPRLAGAGGPDARGLSLALVAPASAGGFRGGFHGGFHYAPRRFGSRFGPAFVGGTFSALPPRLPIGVPPWRFSRPPPDIDPTRPGAAA